MSINDPVIAVWSQKHGHILMRGSETFYDEDRRLRSWETAEEAAEWAMENLGVSPLDHLPERERSIGEDMQEKRKNEPWQRKLL